MHLPPGNPLNDSDEELIRIFTIASPHAINYVRERVVGKDRVVRYGFKSHGRALLVDVRQNSLADVIRQQYQTAYNTAYKRLRTRKLKEARHKTD